MGKNKTDIIDISPEISEDIAVFPGDCPFSSSNQLSLANGDNLTLSKLTTTPHIGAHADAPSHYHKDGQTIEQRNLQYYLGPCQVIDVNIPAGKRIYFDDIKAPINAPRVLFKTSSFPNIKKWNNDFNSLSPSLVEKLAKLNVVLVGIDTPSVDLANDGELLSHNAIYKHDMAILEGLDLTNALAGLYQLIALPLKIKGLDASPVRAILIKD